jgi:hypothetical protein
VNNILPQLKIDGSTIVYYVAGQNEGSKNNIASFLERYKEEDRAFLVVLADSLDVTFHYKNYNNIKIFSVDMSSRVAFGRCVLQESISFDTLAQKIEASKLVLVDDQQRIRGYYDPKELVEIDRLNTELYILLNE